MLRVRHVPQSNPQGRNSCVPACASMVLQHQGVSLDEQELCDLLETHYVVEYEPGPSADPPTITGYTNAAAREVALASASPGAAVLIIGTNLGTSGTLLFDGIPFTAAALQV